MQNVFIQFIFLILIILAFVMLANKLRIAYPIVLVVGGLVISFTIPFSNITIDPEVVFFIFLPPLLYEAAWQISWKIKFSSQAHFPLITRKSNNQFSN